MKYLNHYFLNKNNFFYLEASEICIYCRFSAIELISKLSKEKTREFIFLPKNRDNEILFINNECIKCISEEEFIIKNIIE